MDKLRSPLRERGIISTGGLGSVLGGNGPLQSVIREKAPENGLEHSTPPRTQLELTMQLNARSVAIKLKWTYQRRWSLASPRNALLVRPVVWRSQWLNKTKVQLWFSSQHMWVSTATTPLVMWVLWKRNFRCTIISSLMLEVTVDTSISVLTRAVTHCTAMSLGGVTTAERHLRSLQAFIMFHVYTLWFINFNKYFWVFFYE